MVAVAIGAAAVVGAGATVVAGNSAAHAQQHAADTAISEQQREADQTRADYAPWRAAGSTALDALMSAYGIGGSKASTPYGGFKTSPGYQFEMDQGEQAVNRAAAARGNFASGATIKAGTRYAEGLASGDFNSYTGGLEQIAGLGTAGQATSTGAGETAANNISNELIASGNARASSYANTGSAINSGINNVMSAYLMQNMFKGDPGATSVGYI